MATLYSGNNHYYQVIDQYMSWDSAKTYAESLTYNGQQGYLATITGSGENDFVYSLARQNLSSGDWESSSTRQQALFG